MIEQRADEIAATFARNWESAWNSTGAAGTAQLYTRDSVLVGAVIAVGRPEIERALGMLYAQGWTRIAVKVINAREVGELVLIACEFVAAGSGPNAGKTLSGRSSHALTRVDGTWLSAMHSAA
ncbi:MAG: SgcJ/EcaC family oxidoreductase [Roseiarcus sp.]|jgi:uncharacterized protein (TIGR02246 family)